MSILFVILCVILLTSLLGIHIYNENILSKRIYKAGYFVEHLLDQHGITHLNLEKKFERSTLTTQIRVVEYYLNALHPEHKDLGSRKSVYQRIANIEKFLAVYYNYQERLSLI